MSPYTLLAALLAVPILVILFRLYQGRSPRRFASGGYITPPVRLSYPFITRPDQIPEKHRLGSRVNAHGYPSGHRNFGNRTRLPTVRPIVDLTPRMLERINIHRKLSGRPPLNHDGFKSAVARACIEPRRQPVGTENWIGYLIAYEVMFGGHQSNRVACDDGIAIDPSAPYNGQGGAFAGAGASGQWDAGTAQAARDIASGASSVALDRAAFEDSSGNPQIDPYAAVADAARASVAVAEPTPASAPDPAPSYPDPSPSYDSGSSSSSDSGSSGGGSD